MSLPFGQEPRGVVLKLIVETEDGEVLFRDEVYSMDSLEESSLRKADHAIDEYVNEEPAYEEV